MWNFWSDIKVLQLNFYIIVLNLYFWVKTRPFMKQWVQIICMIKNGQELHPKPKLLFTTDAHLFVTFGTNISNLFNVCFHWVSTVHSLYYTTYRKVASSNMSHLEAYAGCWEPPFFSLICPTMDESFTKLLPFSLLAKNKVLKCDP